MNNQPDKQDEPSKRMSLLQGRFRGGRIALGGFRFQDRYALIYLIESLQKRPDFSQLALEKAEDVEARFDTEAGATYQMIQVKNHEVRTPDAREIIKHFYELDGHSPGTWASFVIACRGLDPRLRAIHNSLEEYRKLSVDQFHPQDLRNLADTRADVKDRIEKAKFESNEAVFVIERVYFQPDLNYQDDEWVESRALDLLQKTYSLNHETAQDVLLRLCRLLSESIGGSISRQQVENTVQSELDRHAGEQGSEAAGKPVMQAPQRPPKYVERPEALKDLKEMLLPVESGDLPRVSSAILHGMAGSGKSVLAAAFAHDEAVQDAFPDGVLWVTLGTQPDLPQRLADWGRALDDPSVLKGPYPDAQAGTDQIHRRLQDKACLLVVDDVWERKHAEPFRVGGSKCLLLVTSRKADVLRGAIDIPLEKMRKQEALKLMANWAEGIAAEDEATAAEMARALGYLPLAMELTGAQVLELGSWQAFRQLWDEEKLAAIERGWDPESPEDSLLLSLELSWKTLRKNGQQPFLKLSIFPEDTPFPASATAALWGWKEPRANKLLSYLAGQALLTPRSVDGDQWYTLHDVLYDFAADRLGEEGRVEAHAALVDGYRDRCKGAWAGLKPDGYIHDSLAWHMAGARLNEDLYTLIDKAWMDTQLERTRSPHTFARDIDLAIAAASAEEPVNWVQLVRGCLATATLGNAQPGLVRAMAQTGQVDRALGYAALTRFATDRYEAYRMIGEALLEQGEGDRARDAFGKALDAAQEIGREDRKAEALRTLAPLLARLGDRERLRRVLAAARELKTPLECESALREVAKALAEVGDREDVRQALEAVAEITRVADSRLEGLSTVVQAMVRLEDRVGLGQAMAVVEETSPEGSKAEALSILAGAQAQVGDGEEASDLAKQALAAADAAGYDELTADALRQVAKRLSRAELRDETALAARQALAATVEIGDEQEYASTFEAVSQSLAEVGDTDGLTAALSMAQVLDVAWCKAKALTSLARAMFRAAMAEEAAQVASEALAATTSIGLEPSLRSYVLSRVALAMLQMGREDEAVQQARQALAFAQAIPDEGERAHTLSSLAELLAPVDEKAASQALARAGGEPDNVEALVESGREALADAKTQQSEWFRARVLVQAALFFSWAGDEGGVREALTLVEGIKDPGERAVALGLMIPTLAEAQMERETVQAAGQAWALVGEIGDESKKVEVLSKVALALAQMGQAQDAAAAARQVLAAAENASQADEAGDDLFWIWEALRATTQAAALINDHESLNLVWGRAQTLPEGEDKALTLTTVAEALLQVERLDEAARAARGAVAAVQTMDYEFEMESVFHKLAPVLVQLDEHAGLKRLLQQAESMQADRSRAKVLGQLALALAQAGMRAKAEEASGLALASVYAVEERWIGTYLEVLGDLIPVLAQVEMVEEARGACELALAKAERLDPEERSKKLEVLALDLVQAGMEDEAVQAVELATLAAEEMEEEEDRIGRLANLAHDLAQVGMADKAEEVARRTLQAVAAAGDEQSRVENWSILAKTWTVVGIVESAERAAKLALAETGACEEEIDLANLIPALARDSDGLQRAMATMERIEDGWSKTRACAGVAQALVRAGMESQAADAIELGLRSAEAATIGQETERAQMLCEMGKALLQVGMPDRAGLEVWEALAIAAELGGGRVASRVLGNAILAVGQVGDRELLEQAWAVAEALPVEFDYDRESKAPVFGQLARAFAQVGMAEEATKAARMALAVAGDMEHEYSRAETLSRVALVLVEAGMPEEATQATQGALAAIGELDAEWSRGGALYEVAPALARVGDAAGLEGVQADAEALVEEEYKALALGGIVQALAITEDHARLARALTSLRELGYHQLRIDRLCRVAQALAQAGMKPEALSITREALDASKAFGDDRHKANSLRTVIRTFARMGHSDGLEEAGAVADSIQDKIYKTEALSTLTWALEQVGEQERATLCLGQALVEARLAGRHFLFEALGCGANTLAAIDKGKTLWEVSEAIVEVDGWWGAKS